MWENMAVSRSLVGHGGDEQESESPKILEKLQQEIIRKKECQQINIL